LHGEEIGFRREKFTIPIPGILCLTCLVSSDSPSTEEKGLEVRTYFVRGRNALVARADFSELYVDYYLHMNDHGLRPEPRCDALFKDALAAMTLHCASRPWNEIIAWTINFQNPLVNLFLTGNSVNGTVVGTLFTEDVKKREHNLFCADIIRGQNPPHRSLTDFVGSRAFSAVEQYYEKSEQRRARFFEKDEEDFVLVSAQPDCDPAWLESLDNNAVQKLDQTEELSLLEQRYYRWSCGCNLQRMFSILADTMRQDPEALFENEAFLRMNCPRCGARYTITKEALEAFVENGESKQG